MDIKGETKMKEIYNQQCPACGHICKPNVEPVRREIAPNYLYVTAVYRCNKCKHTWNVDFPVAKKGRISIN